MKITAKNNTTKGFLLCFRPFPMEEGSIIRDDDSDLKSFSVIEKPKSKSSSKVYSSDKESIDRNQKKTARRRILSKIVKAMAFQSSLSNKKVRNGKIIQDPLQTGLRNQKSRRRSSSSLEEEIDSSILSSSSSSLSVSSSSSIASSWTSSSDSNRSLGSISGRRKSFRSDSIEDVKKQNISSSTQLSTTDEKKMKISGICLLLISLFVLIFWGKFFAILCTSTWFYFVSTTRRNSDDGDNERQMLMTKSPEEIPSKEYKKKIIMEGLLERNKHRGCFHLH